MPNTNFINKELFSMIKAKFSNIKLGNDEGMVTNDPEEAVFFDFDFKVDTQKIATISISLVDERTLKLYFTKDILNSNDYVIRKKWFEFIKQLRVFAKRRLLNFDPYDIAKKNLDRRDYNQMSAEARKNKEKNMHESSLYGSSKSSYQRLENARMIIRHSKKVQEEAPLSRTRNIDLIYVENQAGERFKYPYNHLSGARAMMRHLANGGNPYDNFGQYIVGLSEQVYNLRKFNNLVNKNSFLENSEINSIAVAAKQKTESVKKTLEKLQKQNGYETIKENFVEFKKADIDEKTLETLKSKFTLQQFNEELIDLFPYISDLISEQESSFDRLVAELTDNNELENKEPTKTYDVVKEYESALNQIIGEENSILSTNDDVKKDAISSLSELMSKHFPVGTNGLNAIESLKGIIDNEELNQKFKELSEKDADSCARETVLNWLESNAPDVVDQIDLGDFKATEDNTSAYELDTNSEDKENNSSEIEEFVKSMYDYTTNNFPRGETGVLIAVDKKFGSSAVNDAKQVIDSLKAGVDEAVVQLRKLAGLK